MLSVHDAFNLRPVTIGVHFRPGSSTKGTSKWLRNDEMIVTINAK
jgi:hypothetical protein